MGRPGTWLVIVLLGVTWARAAGTAAPTTQMVMPPGLEHALKCVPDDTHLAVVVPNLEELAVGCGAFGRAIGAEPMSAESVTDRLRRLLGERVADLDRTGPLILAVPAENANPVMIGMVNGVGTWQAAPRPAELPEDVRLFEVGDEHWAAVTKDRVAILAREKEDLQRALRASGRFASRWTQQATDQWAGRQIVLWIDVPAWRGLVEERLAVVTQGIHLGMAAAGPEAETAIELWKALLEQGRKLLADTETVVVAARIDADGLLLSSRAVFKADSGAARYLQQVRKTKRDLLRGLPAGECALLFGCEWEMPAESVTLNEVFAQAVFNLSTLKEKVGAEKLEAALRKNAAIYRQVSGYNAGFLAAPGGAGLLYCGLYLSGDGVAVQRELRAVCDMCPELMNAWGTLPSASLVRESEQIAGVEADAYRFRFGDDAAPAQIAVQAVYGKDPVLYTAPHADGVAYVFGPREGARELLGRLLAVKDQSAAKNKRIAAFLAAVSPDPQGCLLIDAPRLFGMLRIMTERLGAPVPPVEIPDKDLPLIGCTMYLEPQAVRGELLVPAAPIEAIFSAVKQLEGNGGAPR